MPTATHSQTAHILTFGLPKLDQLLGELRPGQLVVLAGWPASGLSALARQIVEHAAETRRLPTGIVLLDTDEAAYVQALLLARARVSAADLREGTAIETDFARLDAAAKQLADLPLYFDALSAATLDDLCLRLRQSLSERAIRLLFVDGFEVRASVGAKERSARLIDLGESSKVTAQIKALALELGLIVVLLCRVSSEPAQTQNGAGLAGLGNCADLATHADVVLLLQPNVSDARSVTVMVSGLPESESSTTKIP